MRKHLIITLVAVLLIVVGLSGCLDDGLNEELEYSIYGEWKKDGEPDWEGKRIWRFYSSSFRTSPERFPFWLTSYSYYEGTYKIEGSKITLNLSWVFWTSEGGEDYRYSSGEYEYKITFQDYGRIAILDNINGDEKFIFRKVE